MARPTAAQVQARTRAERAERAHTSTTDDREAGGVPMTAHPYDPLLTIEQVSDWLGIPKGTLYQWRCRHLGPRAIKVGGGLRYRRAEVEAFLDQHTDARSR